MEYFFASPDVFWNQFVLYFVLLSGCLAFVEYQFICNFMGVKSYKFRCFFLFLALYYAVSATCMEFAIAGLMERFIYFAFLFCFAYLLGKTQKQQNISLSLAASLLIITVLTLCDGIIAPTVYLLPSFGAFESKIRDHPKFCVNLHCGVE